MNARWIAGIALIALAILVAVHYFSAPVASTVEGSKVDFIGSGGAVSTVYVEIADTPQEEQDGLMYRTSLAEDSGMLFVFDGDWQRSFWMKNTPLPLDMVFVDSELNIVDINHNATPESETVFTSRAPCKYVVEVNGGYCDAHRIAVGDKIKIYG